MAYRMEWHPRGVVKHFEGCISFLDVYQSECEIQGAAEFDRMRYVISVFEGAEGLALSKAEREHILALRLGARNTNSRIKYAYVSNHESVRDTVSESVSKSNSAFPVKIFDNFQDALDWARS